MMEKTAVKWKSRTRRDLIIEVWEALDCESVGAHELEQIQQVLLGQLGDGAQESPASIARTVADEGAVLRHPEVFAYDSKWREGLILEASPLSALSFSSLADASESMGKLESWRSQISVGKSGQAQMRRLREFTLKTREELELDRRSRIVDPKRRSEAEEIVQWLTIWLQDPVLFEDWLSLRRRSPDFLEKFR